MSTMLHFKTYFKETGQDPEFDPELNISLVFRLNAQGNMILRGIGIIRSGTKIGLRNLAFNLDRYGTLCVSHR